MRSKLEYSVRARKIDLFLLAAFAAGAAFAQGNIDSSNKHAWAENAGWVNFAPTNGGATVVLPGACNYIFGYVWAENIGWIKMGNTNGGPYQNTATNNWGVNIASSSPRTLSGYAWSENCGWVHFSPTNSQATITMGDGRFDGYAWAENIGWIHFKNVSPVYNVQTTARLPNGAVFFVH